MTLNLLDPVDLDHGLVPCTKPPCPVKRNIADNPTSTDLPQYGNFPCSKPPCPVKRDLADDPITTDQPTFGNFPCTKPPCPIKRYDLDNPTTTNLPRDSQFPCVKPPCPAKRDGEIVIDKEDFVKDPIVKRDMSENELGHDPCFKPPCPQKRSANVILGGCDYAGKITLDFNPNDHPSTFGTLPFSAFPMTTANSDLHPSGVLRSTKRSSFMLS